MFRDFKYSFLFLGKFLLVYFCANVVYGMYIDSFEDVADPITNWVTQQTSTVLTSLGVESSTQANDGINSISMRDQGEGVINVFEGCNGINVMIVFVAFLVAYGGSTKRMFWFLPLGLMIIHIFNVLRIILLFVAAQQNTHYFYYIHKYFFTAALYVVVVALWILWIGMLNSKTINKVEG